MANMYKSVPPPCLPLKLSKGKSLYCVVFLMHLKCTIHFCVVSNASSFTLEGAMATEHTLRVGHLGKALNLY